MIPAIEKKAICITSDYSLGALISSYFNTSDTYFTVFDFLSIDEPKEGLFFEIISSRLRIIINNKIREINPDYIILAGLTGYGQSYFSSVSKKKIIIINNHDDLDVLQKIINCKFDGELHCKKSNIFEGLLVAKQQKKKLVINESANKVFLNQVSSDGAVVVEKEYDISSIAAVNYCFAINANLLLVKKIDNPELDKLKKDLKTWGESRSQGAYKSILKKIRKRVNKIKLSSYKFITFFTSGIPYGFGIENVVETTHVFRSGADHFIINNLLIEINNNFFNSALLFSPQVFDIEETSKLINIFKTKNIYCKDLIKNNATTQNLSKYFEHYPYDILHICTHGGELSGEFTVQKFKDRNGVEHQVEYYEIVTFELLEDQIGSDGKPMVGVITQAILQKFNGYRWMSPELRSQNLPDYIFEDMWAAMNNSRTDEADVVRVKTDYTIPTSRQIYCCNGPHQVQFHVLAGQTNPFIFNNSCSSWFDIAHTLTQVGARGYIGTLWNIDTGVATESALKFYNLVFAGYSISSAVFEINRQITKEKYKNIYIYWGLHFSKINAPDNIDTQSMTKHLRMYSLGMIRKIVESDRQEIIENSYRILKFLIKVLKNEFNYDLSKEIKNRVRLHEIESVPDIDENDSERSAMIM